jgi:predicted dehydrogenase
MHRPNLQKFSDKYEIRAICNRTGSKAKSVAQQFGAAYATTDYHEILNDSDIDLTMICTRHNLHGKMVLDSLNAGKHTFVEKPLCTSMEELEAIQKFYGMDADGAGISTEGKPLLMMGFNRRFSKYAREVKKHVQERMNPLFLHYRMNAGYIPLDHWVHTEEGGGRIVGEACHIIDLFSCLVDAPVKSYVTASLFPKTSSISTSDNKTIVLEYEDGSVATLEYFSVGSKLLSKETLEVHFDEKSIIMDDYKYIKGFGVKVADLKPQVSDKGQLEELGELAKSLSTASGKWPMEITSLVATTDVSITEK